MNIKLFKLLLLFTILLVSSCDYLNYQAIEIRPLSSIIEGELGNYFEIVDDSYTFKETGKYPSGKINPKRYGHTVRIMVKRNSKQFGFNSDSLQHTIPVRSTLFLELVNESGEKIQKLESYTSSVADFKSLLSAKTDSIIWVEFDWIYIDDIEHLPELPTVEVKFKTYSVLKFNGENI